MKSTDIRLSELEFLKAMAARGVTRAKDLYGAKMKEYGLTVS